MENKIDTGKISLDKIKDAISLATLLPELISKYDQILAKIDSLNNEIANVSKSLNGNSFAINALKESLEKFKEENNKTLSSFERRIDSIYSRTANQNLNKQTLQPKQEDKPIAVQQKKEANKQDENKNKKPDKDEVLEKLKLLMKAFSGRKSMRYTKIQIAQYLKVDDAMAEKIIERATSLRLYDDATKTLKYKDIKD